jgi:hypothetical protein
MIQSLLSKPKLNTPQEVVVSNQYLNERQLFDKTAKYWTYIYAMNKETKQIIDRNEFEYFDVLVKNLMKVKNMSRDQSLATLSYNGWDYNRVSRAQPNRATHLPVDIWSFVLEFLRFLFCGSVRSSRANRRPLWFELV